MSDQKTWVTAQDHVDEAQSLLAAAQFPDGTAGDLDFLVALARAHIDLARLLTEMEAVRRARQAQIDAKAVTSAMLDRLPGRRESL